jgi:ribulose-5-phosphate 4-epimerase/fuculose-1-phosphate aldolase
MNQSESVVRTQLARVHRLAARLNWSDPLETHIAARIPDEDAMVITPSHGCFDTMTAEALVKIDFNGTVLGDGKDVTVQAMGVHLPVYRRYPEIRCSIHSHTENITAVSSLKCGLLNLNQHVLRFYDEVAYLDFGGLATMSEGEQICKVLAGRSVVILRNHGSVVYGRSIEEAVYRQYHLEWACGIQLKTMAAGAEFTELSDEQGAYTKAQFDAYIDEALHRSFLESLYLSHGVAMFAPTPSADHPPRASHSYGE